MALGWLLVTMVGWNQAIVLLGLLGVVQFLPVLVFGLFGGIIADIWPKRYTVIGTQTAAGILALTLGGLVYFNAITVWQVFVLAFLLGLVNAADMPARQSFVVEMVGPEDVTNAVALNSAVFNGARVVGPAVAGILIALAGTASCFILNGLSYGAVVVGLLAMRDRELRPADRLAMPRSVAAVGENLGEGLRYVWHTPIVLLAITRDRVRLHVRDELQRGPAGNGRRSPEGGAERLWVAVLRDGGRGADRGPGAWQRCSGRGCAS